MPPGLNSRRPGAPSRSSPPSLLDYAAPLTVCAIFVCACLAGVLSIHLNLADRHRQGRQPIHPSGPAAGTPAAGTPGSAATVDGAGPQQTQQPVAQQQGAAQATATNQTAAAWPGFDDRLSQWAEQLSPEELHGGWKLSWEIFDRATKHPNATVLSWSAPRVLLIRDFLQPQEIEHMVELATGSFARSEVVSDGSKQHIARTSSGAWLSGPRRTETVRQVQHRIHQLVGIPEAFGESLYVLRYQQGQKYEAHTDHCALYAGDTSTASCTEFLQRAGGPRCGPGGGGVTCGDRLATFILYLRSPTRGGTTVFPRATRYHVPAAPGTGVAHGQAQQGGQAAGLAGAGAASGGATGSVAQSRRLRQHGSGVLTGTEGDAGIPYYCQEGAAALQVAPPPGSAVLFWDYVPAGAQWQTGDIAAPDPTSIHGGCPVLEGTKLIATRWIRAAEFH